MPIRALAIASAAAMTLALWPAMAEAGERWRYGGPGWHGGHGWQGGPPPWAGPRRGWGGPPVIVVPPRFHRPPPVIIIPGHPVPYGYGPPWGPPWGGPWGHGPSWRHGPFGGEAELRLRLPFR